MIKSSSYQALVLVLLYSISYMHGLQCDLGQVEVTPHGSGKSVCCNDITCPPGTEAKPCQEDDPNSSRCDNCSAGYHQAQYSSLSHRLFCTYNTNCTKEHKEYIQRGSSTTESKCGACVQGYKNTNIGCIENICPPGQEPRKDYCQPCGLGNFSAQEDNKPCDRRTACDCTLTEGNSTVDNECTQDMTWCTSTKDGPFSTPPSSTSLGVGQIVGIVFGVLSLIVVVGVAIFVAHRRCLNSEGSCERVPQEDTMETGASPPDTPPKTHLNCPNGTDTPNGFPSNGASDHIEKPIQETVSSSHSTIRPRSGSIASTSAPQPELGRTNGPHPETEFQASAPSTGHNSKHGNIASPASVDDKVDLDSRTSPKSPSSVTPGEDSATVVPHQPESAGADDPGQPGPGDRRGGTSNPAPQPACANQDVMLEEQKINRDDNRYESV